MRGRRRGRWPSVLLFHSPEYCSGVNLYPGAERSGLITGPSVVHAGMHDGKDTCRHGRWRFAGDSGAQRQVVGGGGEGRMVSVHVSGFGEWMEMDIWHYSKAWCMESS